MSSENFPPLQLSRSRRSQLEMSRSERLLVAMVTVAIVVVMALASRLTPDPRGFGTHQQLGLPPCGFLTATGITCPHCGLTTSFCWFVRGEWDQSWHVNPAGSLLAVGCVGLWPFLLVMCLRGNWAGIRAPGMTFLIGSAGWLLLSLMIWILRLAG